MMSFLVTHTGFFQTLDIIIIPKNRKNTLQEKGNFAAEIGRYLTF